MFLAILNVLLGLGIIGKLTSEAVMTEELMEN